MAEVARLTRDGEFKITGELNERLPAVQDGLVAHFPFDGTHVGIGYEKNHLKYREWIVGGSSPWGSNGGTSKNSIILDTDPFGKEVPIFQAYNTDESSTADGGWSAEYFTVDPTKKYRFTTWIRRTVLGNGSFYFGTQGDTVRDSSGNLVGNPYFDVFSASGFVKDEWLLVVAYIMPHDTANGFNPHGDSGVYNTRGEKVGSTTSFKWAEPTTTSSYIRSYLYYSTTVGTTQQWVYPSGFIMDGTEPTLEQLLSGEPIHINPKLEQGLTTSKDGVAIEDSTTNLVTNTNLNTGWSKGYCTDLLWDTIAPPEGVDSPVVGFYDNDTNKNAYWYSYGDYTPQTPNTRYIVSLYVKTRDPGFEVNFYTASNTETGRYWSAYKSVPNDGEWHRVVWDSFLNSADSQSDSLSFNFKFGSEKGEGQRTFFCAPQMEAKEFATSFVEGSRNSGKFAIQNPVKTGDYTVNFKLKINTNIGSSISHQAVMSMGNYYSNNSWTIMDTHSLIVGGTQKLIRKGNSAEWDWSTGSLTTPSNFKEFNQITIVRNSTHYRCYSNGIFVGEITHLASDMQDLIWVGSINDGGQVGSSIIKDLSIYNRALTDDEVAKNYKSSMNLQADGGLISRVVKEKTVGIPDGAYCFPLGFDGKDELKSISPVTEENTVYENGAVWIGGSATNMWAANKTEFTWTTGTGTVTRDIPSSEIIPPFDFTGGEVIKMESTSDAFGTIPWTVPGISAYPIGTDMTHSVYVYMVDGDSIGIGQHWNPWSHNHQRYVKKNTWTRIEVTIPTVDITNDSIALEYYVNKSGGGGKAYFYAPQLEVGSYSTPFVNGTRAKSRLHLDKSIINNLSSFTVGCSFKIPYFYESSTSSTQGISGNWYNPIIGLRPTTIYDSREGWGIVGSPNASGFTRQLRILGDFDAPSTVSLNVNTWYDVIGTYDGATYKLYLDGEEVVSYASSTPPTTRAETVFMVGGGYNGMQNSFIRDLIVKDGVMTADEIKYMHKNKLNQYSDKIQISNKLMEGEIL